MSALILSAVLFAQSHWDDPSPKGRWAAPTQQLASELLPPEWAADAVSHTVSMHLVFGGMPASVRFNGRPHRTVDGFCSRNTYYTSGFEAQNDGRIEAKTKVLGGKVRLGGCDGIFAHINPGGSLEDSKLVLRWLDWARRSAQSEGPLAIQVTCKDEVGHGKCAAGARQALANLPIGKASIIDRANYRRPHRWNVSVVETQPGQLYWDVAIDATPGNASIDLAWKRPAPF